MAKIYTSEQLMEMYNKLPKDVQDAIMSINTADIIREIGEKRKLMIDKIGELADETGLVMLGLTRPGQYVSHLIERLGINQETAQEITEEINNKILFPIRDSLRKIQEEREEIAEFPEPIKPEISVPEEPLPPTPPPPPPPPEGLPIGESASPAGLPAAEAGAPPIPPNLPIGEEPAIFQAKTKEEIFRLPLKVSEKETPTLAEGEVGASTPPKAGVGVDPYKEPIS